MFAQSISKPFEQIRCSFDAVLLQHVLKRVQPFQCLLGIDIGPWSRRTIVVAHARALGRLWVALYPVFL